MPSTMMGILTARGLRNKSNDTTTDGRHPGDHWERVGVIDTSTQVNFYTHIQVHMGAGDSQGKPEFYLNGDPDSAWVRQAKDDPAGQAPFWILVNPSENAIHYSCGSVKYLAGVAKATRGALVSRA